MHVEALYCTYFFGCDQAPVAIVHDGPNGAMPLCYAHLSETQRAQLHLERARLFSLDISLPKVRAA